jgi:hypothetical protein
MYITNEEINQICSNISNVAGKYILIKEIFTQVSYNDHDQNSFISFGFGRDYSSMFNNFELKEKEIETININNKEVEFYTYLFKKI